MKLLVVGDIHLRGTNPRNRVGDYQEDILQKMAEVQTIASRHDARVLQVGDIFDSPGVGYAVFAAAARVMRQHKPWLAIPGNHDEWGHSLASLPRTPYGALASSGLITHFEHAELEGTHIIGVGFDHTLDKDLHEYTPQFHEAAKRKVLVVHGMLMPHHPPFDRYTYIDDAARVTTADVVITGHYHIPFIHQREGKLFINPGALCRMSATDEEINRTPSVVLLDTDTLQYQIIPLGCAKPGAEVLDRTSIEAEHERDDRMEKFIASLSFTSESHMLNLQEIIERIAKEEGTEALVSIAMQKLAEAREKRG